MIELNAQTRIADLLNPMRDAAVPAESIHSSAMPSQDFSGLLTEMTGSSEAPAGQEKSKDAAEARDAQDATDEATPSPEAGTPAQAQGQTPSQGSAPAHANGKSAPAGSESKSLTVAVDQTAADPASSALEEVQEPAIDPEMEKAWADVQKFEFTEEAETADAVEDRMEPKLQPRAAAEAVKPALVTTDPIANTQQQELPQRMLSALKGKIEAPVLERTQPENGTAAATSNETTAVPAAAVTDAANRAGVYVAPVRAAHFVEIPNMPHVQVVRTVAMQVGDADSQVLIHIRERGGDLALQLKTANEPLHQNLQSSVNALVRALKREEVQVSSVEVSRKAILDKVKRMKEAR